MQQQDWIRSLLGTVFGRWPTLATFVIWLNPACTIWSAILESYPDWVVALNNAAMYLRLLGEPHSAVEFLEHSYQVQLRDVEHSPNSYHQESLLSFTQGLLFDTLIHASMFEELIDHTREIPESLAPVSTSVLGYGALRNRIRGVWADCVARVA